MLDIKEKRHITVVGRGGASNVDWDDIQNKPEFATVATSGDYDDLSDKPNLATVATSGDYDDLTNKPTILVQWFGTQQEYDAIQVKDPNVVYNIEGGGQVQANWTEADSSDPSYIQNKPTLATVATSGSYSDLSNTPNLATVATTGSYPDLLDTPNLATVATSGSYNDLSNKPSMSTETLTFTLQGGTTQTIVVYTQPTI